MKTGVRKPSWPSTSPSLGRSSYWRNLGVVLEIRCPVFQYRGAKLETPKDQHTEGVFRSKFAIFQEKKHTKKRKTSCKKSSGTCQGRVTMPSGQERIAATRTAGVEIGWKWGLRGTAVQRTGSGLVGMLARITTASTTLRAQSCCCCCWQGSSVYRPLDGLRQTEGALGRTLVANRPTTI